MMENKYTWDLTDIFKTMDEFDNEVALLVEKLEQIKIYEGKLKDSPSNLFKCYNLYEKALEHYRKIYAYGMLKFHLDMANSENIKLFKECQKIGTRFKKATSFITPEITEIPIDTLVNYLNENDLLKKYERELNEIIENQPHILSKQEENLIASFAEVFASPKNAYDILTNTELHFGKIVKPDGSIEEITYSSYPALLKDKSEDIRKQAFMIVHLKYKEFINTIAELYITKVKQETTISKMRKYQSSLERAAQNDEATIKIFDSLITAIHQNISENHKLIELKRRMINKNELHMYDMLINPFETENDIISFETAKNEVINVLSIMGEKYLNTIKQAFDNRWIDAFPKNNKRGGAYMMNVYGVHPYILNNFIGSKEDISTIIHELGHAMHRYYSNDSNSILDS